MKKILLSLVIFGSGLCVNAKGAKGKFEFSVIPKSPIVSLSNISIPQKGSEPDIEIEGPWFKMGFEVRNSLFEVYTLKQIEINFYDRETGDYYQMATLYPKQGDFFAVIKKGKSYKSEESYYIDGLPKLKNKSTRYRIEAEVIGWPGPPEDPSREYEFFTEFLTK